MNWDLALALSAIVLTVLLSAVGVEMANNPPTGSKQKWTFRGVFLLLGSLLIVVNYSSALRNANQQARDRADAALERQRIESQYDALRGKLDTIAEFSKNPPPSFNREQIAAAVHAMVGPRLALGPEAYKDISDAQVGQWAIEEARKILTLADLVLAGQQREPRDYRYLAWRFGDNFEQCCAKDVQGLRGEILRRLGPPGKDLDEISAWEDLLHDTKNPMGANQPLWPKFQPSKVKEYAPYLHRLGVRLMRRQIPRSAPLALQVSARAAPSEKPDLPFKLEATIQPSSAVQSGYIVVEIEGQFQDITWNMDEFDAAELDLSLIDNGELVGYLHKLRLSDVGKGRSAPSFCTIVIDKKPFSPANPVRLLGHGKTAFRVVRATLFDE